ncbi:MAG TPA: ATP-binding protein [Terriglobales bacterium]|nr:ATP-binding protein [Terriglobales bacterium]
MEQQFGFRRAVKHGAKLRLAVCGPSGSGKTYTLLTLATELGGPIAVVDTERGSASKYADIFEFDVLELDSYDPRKLSEVIDAAGKKGYQVFCIDSLSHFWMGKDGELDLVDRIARRSQSNNSFGAWKQVTPLHNELVDRIISAPLHVLVSLRAKTEWVLERDEKTGKTAPRKVGLAPVMRDGIEYEFDVCGEMDQENTLIITKSRCPRLTGGVFSKPGKEVADILKEWLDGPPSPAPAKPEHSPAPAATDDGAKRNGSTGLNGAGNLNSPIGLNESVSPDLVAIWKRMCSPRGVIEEFSRLKEAITQSGGPQGESTYGEILRRHGVENSSQFKSSQPARLCAKELFQAIQNMQPTGSPASSMVVVEAHEAAVRSAGQGGKISEPPEAEVRSPDR